MILEARDLLGVMVDVNLHTDTAGDYLEIAVDSYPFPVSLRGKYYYRSGSTLQELRGAALAKFLLERQGKKWDGVPVPHLMAADLEKESFNFYRKKAEKSQRLEPEDLLGTNQELLESLHLYLEEEKMLKRVQKMIKLTPG
jgi:ATP-dependent DNA helicase RecG